MARLLFLNNERQQRVPERTDRYFAGLGVEVDVFWAAAGSFPATLSGYDALYLSGSQTAPWEKFPWIEQEMGLIGNAADRALPMLGVCFGSQILAYTLCGPDSVFSRPQCDVGVRTITSTPALASDPIGVNLPPTFRIFSWHNDEVVGGHPDMTVLARGAECGNHIWRHRTLPVWGVQGHPEAGGPDGIAWFAAYGPAIEASGHPGRLTPSESRPLQTSEAMRLYDNFAEVVRNG